MSKVYFQYDLKTPYYASPTEAKIGSAPSLFHWLYLLFYTVLGGASHN